MTRRRFSRRSSREAEAQPSDEHESAVATIPEPRAEPEPEPTPAAGLESPDGADLDSYSGAELDSGQVSAQGPSAGAEIQAGTSDRVRADDTHPRVSVNRVKEGVARRGAPKARRAVLDEEHEQEQADKAPEETAEPRAEELVEEFKELAAVALADIDEKLALREIDAAEEGSADGDSDPGKEPGADLPEPERDGEPLLEFLPAVDLSTGVLLGFEALVRWRNRDGRLVMPQVLLPWAERNDYLTTLGGWVLEEACNQAAQWPSGIQVAVNVSARELAEGISSPAALKALECSGLNPDRLTIEVTEKVVSDSKARDELQALKELGVNLAVDNVGGSWSMIDNVRTFSIETAKIDREFVWGLEPVEGMNRVIVEAIIQMARSLAIGTVAEGIETPQQLWILRKMGADVGQGYLFAKPLPSDEARSLSNAATRPVFPLPDPGEAA